MNKKTMAVAFFLTCVAVVIQALRETTEENLRRMDGYDPKED